MLGVSEARSPERNQGEEVTHGGRRISKLFSKEQRAYFATHAPEGIELDQLQIFGPIFVLKAKSMPPGAMRKLVAEAWFYPDNTRIFELSTKCAPGEAFDVAARSAGLPDEQGSTCPASSRPRPARRSSTSAKQLISPFDDQVEADARRKEVRIPR